MVFLIMPASLLKRRS